MSTTMEICLETLYSILGLFTLWLRYLNAANQIAACLVSKVTQALVQMLIANNKSHVVVIKAANFHIWSVQATLKLLRTP